jgi:integrase
VARPSKPWYRTERNAWFVNIAGVTHNLGKDRDEAFRRFHLLMAGGTLPESRTTPPATIISPTVGQTVPDYLTALAGWAGANTVAKVGWLLCQVTAHLSELPLTAVTPAAVKAAVEAKISWGPTTRNEAYARVAAMFRWAQKEGRCRDNPAALCRRPVRLSRAAASAPDPDAAAMIVASVKPHLQDILTALYDSGCRPGEVIRVTAAEFDAAHKVWRLVEHKTARRTGRVRLVMLTDRVVAACERLAREHPTGPLYRNQYGRPYTDPERIATAVRRARRRLGLSESIVPYGYRHAFIGDALVRGVPDVVVASMVGHTTPTVIHRNYNHTGERGRELRAALDQVRGTPG